MRNVQPAIAKQGSIIDVARRKLLRQGVYASATLASGPLLWGCASPRSGASLTMPSMRSNIPNLAGTLQEVAVENSADTRMRIPQGFQVRELARTGHAPLTDNPMRWHAAPDGGATFSTPDGGWIYVSNSELRELRQGGVSALRFNAAGELIDAYSICTGTTSNCAGGPTPWGTWLTCEEFDAGLVYECDPSGGELAVPLPALGAFKHEAAAVDPKTGHIYLTEDQPDGKFYRFTPASYEPGRFPDLRSGTLEVAVVDGADPLARRAVSWMQIPNPTPAIDMINVAAVERVNTSHASRPTRYQVAQAHSFNGGEGCWHHKGIIYFTTKGDNRVWALDTQTNTLDVVYDKHSQAAFNPGIDDVDNLVVSAGGDIVVAEDGAEMRLVVVGPDMTPFELVNIIGHSHSEITGPAFSPDGTRLYFSSQQGPAEDNQPNDGRTYEMQGPFFSVT